MVLSPPEAVEQPLLPLCKVDDACARKVRKIRIAAGGGERMLSQPAQKGIKGRSVGLLLMIAIKSKVDIR